MPRQQSVRGLEEKIRGLRFSALLSFVRQRIGINGIGVIGGM